MPQMVDYIKFRPLATDKPKVTYDSMAVRDLGINAGAVKLVKFFQKVAKEQDPSKFKGHCNHSFIVHLHINCICAIFCRNTIHKRKYYLFHKRFPFFQAFPPGHFLLHFRILALGFLILAKD